MSRSAFWYAITNDDPPNNPLVRDLKSLGINEDSVFHNYTSEERPRSDGPFIILRWGDQDRPMWQSVKAFERLTLWVHYPREMSVDYTKLIKILDRIDYVASNLRDYVHPLQPDHTLPEDLDDYILSFVQIGARSGDFVDDGFNTITKYAAYEVFSRLREEITQ